MVLLENFKQQNLENMQPYPPRQVPNPKYLDIDGNPIENEPETIEDPNAKYDMNEIFALINSL